MTAQETRYNIVVSNRRDGSHQRFNPSPLLRENALSVLNLARRQKHSEGYDCQQLWPLDGLGFPSYLCVNYDDENAPVYEILVREEGVREVGEPDGL